MICMSFNSQSALLLCMLSTIEPKPFATEKMILETVRSLLSLSLKFGSKLQLVMVVVKITEPQQLHTHTLSQLATKHVGARHKTAIVSNFKFNFDFLRQISVHEFSNVH